MLHCVALGWFVLSLTGKCVVSCAVLSWFSWAVLCCYECVVGLGYWIKLCVLSRTMLNRLVLGCHIKLS